MKNFKGLKWFAPMMFLVLFSVQLSAQATGGDHDHSVSAVGFHGMALFGEHVTYASHLPMFHAPHNYQAVFQVVVDGGTSAGLAYLKAVKDGDSGLYTLAPKQNFDLVKMIDGELKVFTADIYKGHFEKEGAVKLGEAKISVIKTVFSKDISNLEFTPSRWIKQKYVIFGHDFIRGYSELYALHEVTTQNASYDAIFKVKGSIRAPANFPPKPSCTHRVCLAPISTPNTPGRYEVLEFVSIKANSDLEVPTELSVTGNVYSILETIHLDFKDLGPDEYGDLNEN